MALLAATAVAAGAGMLVSGIKNAIQKNKQNAANKRAAAVTQATAATGILGATSSITS